MRLIMAMVLATATAGVYAGEQLVVPPTPAGAPREVLLPQGGGWWNPAEAGSGYFMQFMTNADNSVTGFATVYTYNADGSSTFLLVQGAVSFASESERVDTGVIARFSSPLYKAANGQPFNGSYRPAEVTPAGLGSGEFVFYTRRTGEFRAGGRSIPIRVLNSLQGEAEYVQMLSGTWTLQARLRRNEDMPSEFRGNLNTYFERSVQHVVQITPLTTQPEWRASDRAATFLPAAELREFWQPPAGALTFAVTCVSDCPPVPHPLGTLYGRLALTYAARIWVDPATGRAGYVTGAQPFGSDPSMAFWATAENLEDGFVGGANWMFDLYLGDDGSMVGRGGYLNQLPAFPVLYWGTSEMVGTKIASTTGVRGQRIY